MCIKDIQFTTIDLVQRIEARFKEYVAITTVNPLFFTIRVYKGDEEIEKYTSDDLDKTYEDIKIQAIQHTISLLYILKDDSTS